MKTYENIAIIQKKTFFWVRYIKQAQDQRTLCQAHAGSVQVRPRSPDPPGHLGCPTAKQNLEKQLTQDFERSLQRLLNWSPIVVHVTHMG